MSYWNQGYNKKKQEELQAKQQKVKPPHHDIYLGNASQWSNAREAQRREAFAWKVGAGIIVILTGLFIWILIEIL